MSSRLANGASVRLLVLGFYLVSAGIFKKATVFTQLSARTG